MEYIQLLVESSKAFYLEGSKDGRSKKFGEAHDGLLHAIEDALRHGIDKETERNAVACGEVLAKLETGEDLLVP